MHPEVFPREQVCLSNWFRYPVPTKIWVMKLITVFLPWNSDDQWYCCHKRKARADRYENRILALLTWLHSRTKDSAFLCDKRKLVPNCFNSSETFFQSSCCIPFPPFKSKIFDEMQVLGNSKSWQPSGNAYMASGPTAPEGQRRKISSACLDFFD